MRKVVFILQFRVDKSCLMVSLQATEKSFHHFQMCFIRCFPESGQLSNGIRKVSSFKCPKLQYRLHGLYVAYFVSQIRARSDSVRNKAKILISVSDDSYLQEVIWNLSTLSELHFNDSDDTFPASYGKPGISRLINTCFQDPSGCISDVTAI